MSFVLLLPTIHGNVVPICQALCVDQRDERNGAHDADDAIEEDDHTVLDLEGELAEALRFECHNERNERQYKDVGREECVGNTAIVSVVIRAVFQLGQHHAAQGIEVAVEHLQSVDEHCHEEAYQSDGHKHDNERHVDRPIGHVVLVKVRYASECIEYVLDNVNPASVIRLKFHLQCLDREHKQEYQQSKGHQEASEFASHVLYDYDQLAEARRPLQDHKEYQGVLYHNTSIVRIEVQRDGLVLVEREDLVDDRGLFGSEFHDRGALARYQVVQVCIFADDEIEDACQGQRELEGEFEVRELDVIANMLRNNPLQKRSKEANTIERHNYCEQVQVHVHSFCLLESCRAVLLQLLL